MTVAEALYREMIAFGLTVEAHDGTLYVSPIEQITDALRARIRAHKPELLMLLSGDGDPPLSGADREAITEAIAERAAIREFDGGEDRPAAEREARSAMRVYHYRLTDRPDIWLTMLAPNCDIAEARRSLALRFGPERLIDVRERESW